MFEGLKSLRDTEQWWDGHSRNSKALCLSLTCTASESTNRIDHVDTGVALGPTSQHPKVLIAPPVWKGLRLKGGRENKTWRCEEEEEEEEEEEMEQFCETYLMKHEIHSRNSRFICVAVYYRASFFFKS